MNLNRETRGFGVSFSLKHIAMDMFFAEMIIKSLGTNLNLMMQHGKNSGVCLKREGDKTCKKGLYLVGGNVGNDDNPKPIEKHS